MNIKIECCPRVFVKNVNKPEIFDSHFKEYEILFIFIEKWYSLWEILVDIYLCMLSKSF